MNQFFEYAKEGSLEGLKLSLRLINVNAKNDDGQGALMIAAHNGKYDAVKFLLENNADPNQADETGSTALMNAAIRGHLDIVNLLISFGADTEVRNQAGYTAFEYAAKYVRSNVLKYLNVSKA